MRVEQFVQVGEHVVDRGPVGVGGVLERLLHPGEPLVEHLAPEQVLDPPVGRGRLRTLPPVVAELAHRRGGGGREAVQLHLGEGSDAVVHLHVTRQLAALLRDGLVQQLADLLERAVEVVLARQLAATLGDTAGEVVEPGLVTTTTAEELPHRALG